MKKEYMKPSAEKVEFNYAENVTACPSWMGQGQGQQQTGGITPYTYDTSFPTRDINQINYECHEHFADVEGVCGQDGHDYSNPFWRCDTN